MRHLTCVPETVSEALPKYKHHFWCPQGRHFVLFCWIEVALILESGRGTLKDLVLLMPERVRYWAVLRLVRSGQWAVEVTFKEIKGGLHLGRQQVTKDPGRVRRTVLPERMCLPALAAALRPRHDFESGGEPVRAQAPLHGRCVAETGRSC